MMFFLLFVKFFFNNGNLETGIFNKNGKNPIRSSYWDEIKCDENTQIISDQNNGWYRFQFRSVDKENILLLIESKHFKQLIETQPRFEKLKSNGLL